MSQPQQLLVLPVPQSVQFTGGACTLPAAPAVTFCDRLDGIPLDRTVLRELGPARRAAERNGAHIVLGDARSAPDDLRQAAQRPEGYALVVHSAGVGIYADSPAGQLYGAITLAQLRRQFGRRLPCMRIGDAPRLSHRGASLVFPQGHTEYRPALAKHIVRELARWKINTLYLYLESYFDFPSLPHTAGPGAMTADQARELDAYCLDHNIQLIPELNVMAHSGEVLTLERYHHLTEHGPKEDQRMMAGFNLCASSPETHRLIDAMLGDMFDAFSSDIIHVGGDEVSSIGQCPRCRKAFKGMSRQEIYLKYFGRVRDVARKAGRRIGIWGDMLLHYYQDAPAAERARVLHPLRDGIVIYDWHYTGGSPSTLKFFTSEGFDTVACSSTNLCYSNSVWPRQAGHQAALFADAIAAGAMGGMTTAWCNYVGLHEEQLNYLFASGGTALWSGPKGGDLAPGLPTGAFDRAYCLQRYGLPDTKLTNYFHTLGDASGPVLAPLGPLMGANLRKCLYHTDNVLTMWVQYAGILTPPNLAQYKKGLAQARKLWNAAARRSVATRDQYFTLLEGPLLTHEHLLKRFEMTQAVYKLYAQAAQAQFVKPARCTALLNQAAAKLLGHLKDFPPVDRYIGRATRELGLDDGTLLRVAATKRGIRDLADFLKYLDRAERALPAFGQLNAIFMRESRTDWYGDREHEWTKGPARFRRYTLEGGPWVVGPNPVDETGPWVGIRQYRVSKFIQTPQRVEELVYPRDLAALRLQPRLFNTPWATVHFDLFKTGEPGYVLYLCRFRCDETMKLRIELGYDGPVKMWLDKKAIFDDPAGTNPAWAGMAKLPFAAVKGTHELCVALNSNCGKAYHIITQLTRMDVTWRPGEEFRGKLPVILG